MWGSEEIMNVTISCCLRCVFLFNDGITIPTQLPTRPCVLLNLELFPVFTS